MSSREGLVGIFTRRSIKVQAAQIVVVADMRHGCQVWGRFSTCVFWARFVFPPGTSLHEGAKTLYSELRQTSSMLSNFIHHSRFSIAFKQGSFAPLTWWSRVLLTCYWQVIWLISAIMVMARDFPHPRGKALFIPSVRWLNHPRSMMEAAE